MLEILRSQTQDFFNACISGGTGFWATIQPDYSADYDPETGTISPPPSSYQVRVILDSFSRQEMDQYELTSDDQKLIIYRPDLKSISDLDPGCKIYIKGQTWVTYRITNQNQVTVEVAGRPI